MCRWCCWGRRRRSGCRSSGCTASPPARSSCSPCWRCSACARRAGVRTGWARERRSDRRRAERAAPEGVSGPGGLQIRVAVELALVEALEGLALRERHAPFADGSLAVARQRRTQLRDVVLPAFEHLVGGGALDDLLNPPAPSIVQPP